MYYDPRKTLLQKRRMTHKTGFSCNLQMTEDCAGFFLPRPVLGNRKNHGTFIFRTLFCLLKILRTSTEFSLTRFWAALSRVRVSDNLGNFWAFHKRQKRVRVFHRWIHTWRRIPCVVKTKFSPGYATLWRWRAWRFHGLILNKSTRKRVGFANGAPTPGFLMLDTYVVQ